MEDTTGGDLATVSSCCHHFVVVKLVYHYYELCRDFPGSAKIIKKPPNFGGLNGIGMRTGRAPDSDAKIMIYRRYGTASTVTAKAVKKYLMSKKF